MALAALVVIFLLSLLIFGASVNLIRQTEGGGSGIYIFVLVFMNIAAALFLFIQLIAVTGKLQKLTGIRQKETLDKKSEVEEAIVEKETVDQAEILAREEARAKELLEKLLLEKSADETEEKYMEKMLSALAGEFKFVQGLYYAHEKNKDEFTPVAEYAYFSETRPKPFKPGETLPGQAAKNKTILYIDELPENYTVILSGLGEGNPEQIVIIPLVKDDETFGVIELASFEKVISDNDKKILEAFALQLPEKMNLKEKTQRKKNEK